MGIISTIIGFGHGITCVYINHRFDEVYRRAGWSNGASWKNGLREVFYRRLHSCYDLEQTLAWLENELRLERYGRQKNGTWIVDIGYTPNRPGLLEIAQAVIPDFLKQAQLFTVTTEGLTAFSYGGKTLAFFPECARITLGKNGGPHLNGTRFLREVTGADIDIEPVDPTLATKDQGMCCILRYMGTWINVKTVLAPATR